jgi:UDP-glucose 4-epimerase
MNLFVTGLTGFCGSHITRRLLVAGHSVWALSRRAPISSETRLTILRGELGSIHFLPPHIDAVIHMAAASPTAATRTADFIRDNIVGTERLIAATVAAGIRKLIFFSSISLYGDIQASTADESTPVLNPGPYGSSKLFGEFALREEAPKLSSIALRLPAVLGAGATRHWLATILQQAKSGVDIEIFNPEAQFNNATHVECLAAFIELLLCRSWTGFDAVTLGAGGGLRISEIAARVVAAAGTGARIVVRDSRRSPFLISSHRARTVYGYEPMDFEHMLNRYLSETKS